MRPWSTLAGLPVLAVACGNEPPAEPMRELTPEQLELTGGEYVDSRLFPAESDIPSVTCRIAATSCNRDGPVDRCCYGPCITAGEVTRGTCLECLPPGLHCIQHEQCCGRCSRECSLREHVLGSDCHGICLLGERDDPCHYDSGCLSGKCVEHKCQ